MFLRAMTCRILLVFSLSFCLAFSLKVNTRFHDCSVTISVEIGKPTTMSRMFLDCVFLSNVKKVLFCFRNGLEHEDVYHPQFKGRVRSEIGKENIMITLAQFKADDVGHYMCKYNNRDDKTSTNETFALDWPTNSDACLTTPEPGPAFEDTKHPTEAPKRIHPLGFFGLVAAVVIVIVALVVWHKTRTAAQLRDQPVNRRP